MNNILSVIVFFPLLAAFIIALLPQKLGNVFKYVAVGANLVVLLLIVGMVPAVLSAQPIDGVYQFVEKANWFTVHLKEFGIFSANYYLGIDGLSFSMLLLAAIVMLVGNIASFSIKENEKTYYFLYLMLATTVFGCFAALDMLLFYVFFEFMLLPMYFLIGMWGGPRREYAAIKFFLYTLFGSLFILIVMIGLNLSVVDIDASIVAAGLVDAFEAITPEVKQAFMQQIYEKAVDTGLLVHSFDVPLMTNPENYLPGSLLSYANDSLVSNTLFGVPLRYLAFLAILIGFAIKLPSVPFHTWLPDAHVEAPVAISVVLAGILLKIGGYGLIRFGYLIFPDGAAHYAYWVGLMGVISIIYGAYNALAMNDLKKMIAYSSVSHMGFVLLGLASATTEGVSGAVYQMFSHGIISSLLFIVVEILYVRTGDRQISSYRGIAGKMPVYTAVVIIAFFASLGLPGFSGFIAEVLVFIGAFKSVVVNGFVNYWQAVAALLGLILGAAYYLWTIQRVFFGVFWVRDESYASRLKDLTVREYIMVVPLVLGVIYFGVCPALLLDIISPLVSNFVSLMGTYAG